MKMIQQFYRGRKMDLVFNNCCFCIDPRSGSLIIGCILLVASISIIMPILMILSFYVIVNMLAPDSEFTRVFEDDNLQQTKNLLQIICPIILVIACTNLIFTVLLLNGVQKVTNIYCIIIPTLLLLGFFIISVEDDSQFTRKFANDESQKIIQKARITLPTILVLASVTLVLTFILLIGVEKKKRGFVKAYLIYSPLFILICASSLMYHFITRDQNFDQILFIFLIILILMLIYFTLVIRSFYLKMDDTETKPVTEKTV